MTRWLSKAIPYFLWVALFGAMIGSVQHVAWSFATLSDGNMWEGYIQAVAVDIGIAALAFGVQMRKRAKRQTLWLWVGVALFSAVSTYANLLYGLAHLHDIGVGKIADYRPFILSAVLPIMVIFLSEIVGEDVQHAVKVAERERRRAARNAQSSDTDAPASDIEKARALDIIYNALTNDVGVSKTKLSKMIGMSRGTVYNYLDTLKQQGRIDIDDNGDITVNTQ